MRYDAIMIKVYFLLLDRRGHGINYECFLWARINKNNSIFLEDIMKKVLSVLALALMVVGLTGCLDPQDGEKQRPSSVASVSL